MGPVTSPHTYSGLVVYGPIYSHIYRMYMIGWSQDQDMYTSEHSTWRSIGEAYLLQRWL
jgi:hypothetical protein